MAGIAGIYSADLRPVDAGDLQRMAGALAHRAPDGTSYWRSGPIGFAHLQFCTTPESLHEQQPLLAPGTETCLVWNGRLDNREELSKAIVSRGGRSVDDTDPGLVLSAYLVWGEACAERLVGDFAFVIWDGRRRLLWCARDHLGVRPFYYFWDGNTFLFASEIRALLTHPRVLLKINEGMVAEYLVDKITSSEDTFYSDIHRLPAASSLKISSPSNGLSIERYWRPDLSPISYQTDDQYTEHFVQLLEESVRCRMRSCVPWATELSGGLDSSTVSVTAQELLNRSGSGQQVSTLSLAQPGKQWDESEYIQEISQFAGLRSECFPAYYADLDYYQRSAAWSHDFPGYPNAAMFVTMYETMRQNGVKVLISGQGGNQLLEGNVPHLLDLASSGDLRRLLQCAKDDWQIYGGRTWQTFLLRNLVSGFAPHWIRSRVWKRRLGRSGVLSRDFMKRIRLAARLYSFSKVDPYLFSSRAQEAAFLLAHSGAVVHYTEMMDLEGAFWGFEYRHPFFDRRLDEFCLKMPEDQRQRGTTWKWILRNATRGKLPERVRNRKIQAHFSELFTSVVSTPSAQDRLRNLLLYKHTDWLNQSYFVGQLDAPFAPSSRQYLARSGISWMALGVDIWLDDLMRPKGERGRPLP
jgi:asparagine synthase (glutamine-hydrolysing)